MDIDSFVQLDKVRRILFALPSVTEGICYGTPGFYVKKKLLVRWKEDGTTLVVHSEHRGIWMKDQPKVFFITEHYRNYPFVLVNLEKVKTKDLEKIIEEAFRQRAGRKLNEEFEKMVITLRTGRINMP